MEIQTSLFDPPPTARQMKATSVLTAQMTPTGDQADVIGRELKPGGLTMIEARAGTGKTTTLQMLTGVHHAKKFLYLCYNKALAESAKTRFGANTYVSTSHALAYPHTGAQYRHKLENLRPVVIRDLLSLSDTSDAAFAIDTVNAYCYSTDAEMGEKHVPTEVGDREAGRVLNNANRLWLKMRDRSSKVPMTHDGYLKLWCLSEPTLEGFDVILLDEAQDANPLLLGLLLRVMERGEVAIVLVGDVHQSIYAFRAATNAMESCIERATERAYLTESFRFPQQVADQANALLHHLKGEKVLLRGRGKGKPIGETFAFLSRTNATLIQMAIQQRDKGTKLNFVGTAAKGNWNPWSLYKFGEMVDVQRILTGRANQVVTPYLRRFRNSDDIFAAIGGVGKSQDRELKKMVDVVEAVGPGLPDVLNDIVKSCTSPEHADLCLATGHRSKGQEWDSVELADDFLPVHSESQMKVHFDKGGRTAFMQDVNLLYVSLTRTRTRTAMPWALESWLRAPKRPPFLGKIVGTP